MTDILYDLSHPDYLGKTDWVSSSQLKGFLPEWFTPFNGSGAADLGSVLHQRFTGDDVPVRVVDALTWQGKAAIAAREAAAANGEYAILTKDLQVLDGMEQSLRSHPEAEYLLLTGDGPFEVSVFTEVDDVPCKARFDRLRATTIVDIKTTKAANPSLSMLAKAVVEYGYDLSAAHYLRVGEAAGLETDQFALVFVSSVAPHYVTVAYLDEAFLERGRNLRELALSRMADETVPAYPGASGPVMLSCPGWARL